MTPQVGLGRKWTGPTLEVGVTGEEPISKTRPAAARKGWKITAQKRARVVGLSWLLVSAFLLDSSFRFCGLPSLEAHSGTKC